MTAKRRSEIELLHQLQAGEQEAWAEFTREYSSKLYTYLMPHLPDPESVEDVLSEVMLGMVKAISQFDGKASLTTLVFAVAQRKVADFWRKRNTNFAAETSHLPADNDTTAISTDRLEHLEMLASLPHAEQDVLLLRYQIGLTVADIAQTMNRSYKAVESLLTRARSRLRSRLMEQSMPSATESAQSDPFAYAIQEMLSAQQQRCLSNGLDEEAALFAKAAQQLQAIEIMQTVFTDSGYATAQSLREMQISAGHP